MLRLKPLPFHTRTLLKARSKLTKRARSKVEDEKMPSSVCIQRVHCVLSIVGSNTRPDVRFDAMYHDDVLITYELTNLLYMADANGNNDGGHDDDNRRSFKRLPESPTGSSPTLRSGSIIRPTSAHGFSAGEILNRMQKDSYKRIELRRMRR